MIFKKYLFIIFESSKELFTRTKFNTVLHCLGIGGREFGTHRLRIKYISNGNTIKILIKGNNGIIVWRKHEFN
jgi:hypothetical protein